MLQFSIDSMDSMSESARAIEDIHWHNRELVIYRGYKGKWKKQYLLIKVMDPFFPKYAFRMIIKLVDKMSINKLIFQPLTLKMFLQIQCSILSSQGEDACTAPD